MLLRVEGKTRKRREFGGHEGVSTSPPELARLSNHLNIKSCRSERFSLAEAPAWPRPVGLLPLSFSGSREQRLPRGFGQERRPATTVWWKPPALQQQLITSACGGRAGKTQRGAEGDQPDGSAGGGRAGPGPQTPPHLPRTAGHGLAAFPAGCGARGAACVSPPAFVPPGPSVLALPGEVAALQLCPAPQPGGARLMGSAEDAGNEKVWLAVLATVTKCSKAANEPDAL